MPAFSFGGAAIRPCEDTLGIYNAKG